eukprot:gene9105-233_t
MLQPATSPTAQDAGPDAGTGGLRRPTGGPGCPPTRL